MKVRGADSFIQRRLLLEPISVRGLTESAAQATVKKEYFPNRCSVMPHDGDKVTVNGAELTWYAVDTRNYTVNRYHFARAPGEPASGVLFWAVTFVYRPRELRDVRLAVGSNAASVLWVNGKEIAGIYGDRQTVIGDGVSKRIHHNRGRNILRAAIISGGGATDFCARFLDPNENR